MFKMQNYIKSFSEKSQDNATLIEAVKDYYSHYRALNIDGCQNVEYIKTDAEGKTISFAEKDKKVNSLLKQQIAKLANVNVEEFSSNPAMYSTNPSIAWATFAIVGYLTDLIIPDSIIESIKAYADVRVVGYGDSASFDIQPRDLFVVTKGSRGKRYGELQKQFRGQKTIVPEMHQVSVYVDLYRVLAGLESLADFMLKTARSIETQMSYDIYAAFNTAMSNLANSGDAALRVAGYTAGNLTTLAQKVSAWNGGKAAVVIGTKNALSAILPDDVNYRYSFESEYVKVGFIRNFRGLDIIELPQIADYATPFKLALDDTKLYVVSPASDKLVKCVIGGEAVSYASAPYDFANLIQTGTIQKQWGVAVATSSIAGVITLS